MMMALAIQACGGGGDGGSGTPAVAAPVITAQPQSVSAITDAGVSFSVVATGDGVNYEWRRNGAPIAGASSSSLSIAAAAYTDHGAQYSVVVSNAGGSVTSQVATLSLVPSSEQQAFESIIVAPNGSHYLGWNLNLSGPQLSGTNYGYSSGASMAASPASNGPQTLNQAGMVNMTSTLALPPSSDSRFLVGGRIVVVNNGSEVSRVSYVGSDVKLEFIATDGTTVAYTERRVGYRRTDLTGTMASTPTEFSRWFNSWFANPAVLNAASPWQSGSAYATFTSISVGDRYSAFDCGVTTTGTAISPCLTGTTLAAAMATGIVSASDGVTYRTADGAFRTVSGVPVWVATAPRPQSATLSTRVEYRIYFELGGNIYTGALTLDAAPLGGSYYVSNPSGATVLDRLTFLPYRVRMNGQARSSMAAAAAL